LNTKNGGVEDANQFIHFAGCRHARAGNTGGCGTLLVWGGRTGGVGLSR
jgi:hypothetical protein